MAVASLAPRHPVQQLTSEVTNEAVRQCLLLQDKEVTKAPTRVAVAVALPSVPAAATLERGQLDRATSNESPVHTMTRPLHQGRGDGGDSNQERKWNHRDPQRNWARAHPWRAQTVVCQPSVRLPPWCRQPFTLFRCDKMPYLPLVWDPLPAVKNGGVTPCRASLPGPQSKKKAAYTLGTVHNYPKSPLRGTRWKGQA